MARRSRKTLQAEGQLSLFAMTDDFLFAVTENTENAVDKAAESRSYVNQIAGEAPADASRKGDEDGRPEATVHRGPRHEVPVMLDNLPEKVAELKASGETESYLEQIEMAYRNRISELTPGCMKSCGATTELRSSDLPSFIKKANSAEAMATEIAIKEIIEAM